MRLAAAAAATAPRRGRPEVVRSGKGRGRSRTVENHRLLAGGVEGVLEGVGDGGLAWGGRRSARGVSCCAYVTASAAASQGGEEVSAKGEEGKGSHRSRRGR